jgi:hypothetical protein
MYNHVSTLLHWQQYMKVNIFQFSLLSLVIYKFIHLTISLNMHCFYYSLHHISTNKQLLLVIIKYNVKT